MSKKITSIIILFFILSILSAQNISATNSQVFNKEVKGKLDTYITNSGLEFSVGDTLYLGVPFYGEQYCYSYIDVDALTVSYSLCTYSNGEFIVIKKIIARFKKANLRTTNPYTRGYSFYVFNFERALEIGELRSYAMSSDEALSEMKKVKDKLDFDLITLEKYDEIKAELSKFIK